MTTDLSTVPADQLPWWRKALALEPALVKGAIALVVAGLLIWGVDVSDVGDRIAQTADVLGALVALLSPLWIRQSVSPAARVVQTVLPDGTVVAGPASPLKTGTVIPDSPTAPGHPEQSSRPWDREDPDGYDPKHLA